MFVVNKKVFLILMVVSILFGFGGCKKQKNQPIIEKTEDVMEISVANQVKEADVWIIPNTEQNKKTSVWGKATIPKCYTEDGKSVVAKIIVSEDKYLIRMIDVDEMFYSAEDITIKAGQSVVIRDGEEDMTAFVEVHNADGTLENQYEMFMARL